MRIAVGGYCHETNCFSSGPVTMEILERSTQEGEEYIRSHTGVATYQGGLIAEAAALGIELIPTRMSALLPFGISLRECFEFSRDRILELLCREYEKQPFDAIALTLHGAGVAEGYPDLEGAMLRAVREKFGPDMPVGMTLDLHGNMSREMVELADVIVGGKLYPHTDEYDNSRILIRMLRDIVLTGRRPCKQLVKLPWHIAPAQGVTTSGPAGDVKQECCRWEGEPGVLHAAFFQGFPYADIPDAGASVFTMAETEEAARRSALAIARYAWSRRRDFEVPLLGAAEAVDKALRSEAWPVVIHESSDNPGGGAPGDGTHLLRELLERDVHSAFGFIYDPEVARQAAAAGVGATIRCSLGGKGHPLHGAPLELEAYVKCVSDGTFVHPGPILKGSVRKMGLTALLVVGNVSIVVSSNRTQTFDDGPFQLVGLDWRTFPVLALKSSQHFKAFWAERAGQIICCDSPGIQASNLSFLPFRYADTSYYPLQDASWDAEA